jgi:hypothetical protein
MYVEMSTQALLFVNIMADSTFTVKAQSDETLFNTVPLPTAMVVGDKKLWDITGQFRALASGTVDFLASNP